MHGHALGKPSITFTLHSSKSWYDLGMNTPYVRWKFGYYWVFWFASVNWWSFRVSWKVLGFDAMFLWWNLASGMLKCLINQNVQDMKRVECCECFIIKL